MIFTPLPPSRGGLWSYTTSRDTTLSLDTALEPLRTRTNILITKGGSGTT